MKKILGIIGTFVGLFFLWEFIVVEKCQDLVRIFFTIGGTWTFIRVWYGEEVAYREIMTALIQKMYKQEFEGKFADEPKVKKLLEKALICRIDNKLFLSRIYVDKAAKIVTKKENKAITYMFRAFIYEESSLYKKALEYYEESSHASSKNKFLYAYKAGLYNEIEDFENLKNCFKAGERFGENYLLSYYQSLYYEKDGDDDKSYEYAVKSANMNENRVDALMHLIELCVKKEDKSDAQKWYKEYCKRLGDTDREYEELIESI